MISFFQIRKVIHNNVNKRNRVIRISYNKMITVLQMIVRYEYYSEFMYFSFISSRLKQCDILFTKLIEIISTHEQEKQQNNVGSKW